MSNNLESFNTALGEGINIRGKNMSQIKNIQQESQRVLEEETRTWEKDEAEEWLEDNNFKTDDYEKMRNWHSFRQEDPGKYDDIRIDNEPFDFDEDDGVQVLYGITDNEVTEIQSIRFYHGKEAG